jgi:phage N-6-adenine-methyltransferase
MADRTPADSTLASFEDGRAGASSTSTEDSEAGGVGDDTSAEVKRVASQQGNDEYGTPRWLIRRLTDAIGGRFALDPAAGAEPTPLAEERYTKAEDGLSQDWTSVDGPIYLNPPYSDPEPWLEQLSRTVDPAASSGPEFAVALTKMDTSTEWFHDHLTDATVLCLLTDRLSYYGGDSSASFASGFSVFGEPPRALLETLSEVGALYAQVEVATALDQQTFDDLLADGGAPAVALPVETPSPPAPVEPGGSSRSTGQVSLDFVAPWDRLELSFETMSLGSRNRGVPERVQVQVVRGGKTIDPTTGSVTVDTIGETPEGTDVCARLRNSPELVSQIEVSLAVGLREWETVTPTAIRTAENSVDSEAGFV